MATQLEKVTSLTRRILEVFAGIIAIFIVGTIIINIGKALNPPPPPPPTVSFGKLPSITFSPSANTSQPMYSLDTLSGNLPSFPSQVAVYKIQQPQPDLLALDKAKPLAQSAGFTSDPTALSETEYLWTNTNNNLSEKFQMDIATQDYFLSSNFLTDEDVLSATNLPDAASATVKATSFLSSIESLPSDIDNNKTKTTLYSISFDILSPATSLSTAQVIRVDFFHKDVNKLPIFYPDPARSLIYAEVASGPTDAQIVEAQFIHKTITNTSATYPIKTASQALTDLKNGKGYVASLDNNTSTVSIQNVLLGYYMSDLSQQYLEPIIVFEGDHNFVAYVPAVTDEWVGN